METCAASITPVSPRPPPQPPPQPPPNVPRDRNHALASDLAEEDWDDIQRLLPLILSLTAVDSTMAEKLQGSTRDSIAARVMEAAAELSIGVVFDEAYLDSLGLVDFSATHYEHNDSDLDHNSLDAILEKNLIPLRSKGLPVSELRQLFAGLPNLETALEVLSQGSRDFMVPDFKPNGGKESALSQSYNVHRRICNDAMVKLVAEGKALAFTMDKLISTGHLSELHTSVLTRADKVGSKKGRVCFHLSYKSLHHPSVNQSVDFEASDATYPMPELPHLPELAEMACTQRDAYPGQRLSGATIDVATAYQQNPQSLASCKRIATKVRIPHPTLANSFIYLVIIVLVGMWGHTRAGNVFCVVGALVSAHINRGRATPQSLTYIDDSMIITPDTLVQGVVDECLSLIRALWGDEGVNYEKVHIYPGALEGIGWHFDFDAWRVQPKTRGLRKLLVYLFTFIPLGARFVDPDRLEQVLGLLMWYAVGLPAGKSFMASLFALKKDAMRLRRGIIPLSLRAQRDINWWRAITIVANTCPHILGADIDTVRKNPTPTIYLRTDASSLVGAGGMASLTKGGEPLSWEDSAIRWTKEELRMFTELEIYINTLEYFAAVFCIMLWADKLKGQVVFVECDNTAAVAWLSKGLAAAGGAVTDSLCKIFSLFCLSHGIVVLCTHLKGELNTVADFRSRSLELLEQAADEDVVHGMTSGASSRRDSLRRLLMKALLQPEGLHSAEILKAPTEVLSMDGVNTARSSV